MSADALMMFGLSTVVGLITTIFWKWVSVLSKERDDDGTQIEFLKAEVNALKVEIAKEYQSKSEAHRDNEQVINMLRDIKQQITHLQDKIDQKADK